MNIVCLMLYAVTFREIPSDFTDKLFNTNLCCQQDTLNGKVFEYYSNGSVKSEIQYLDGKRNGPFKTYWQNGQIHYSGAYTMNNEDGLFITFNTHGDTLSIFTKKMGVLDKRLVVFIDGLPIMEAHFLYSKMNGRYSFYRHGKLTSEVYFRNGCLVSCMSVYDKKGRIKNRLVPNEARDRFVLEHTVNKAGKEYKTERINLLPDSYYLFGAAYHSSCNSLCIPIKPKD